MLKILTIVLIVLVAIIGGFAGYVALQPADFRIVRSTTIVAPAENVFEQVNDFHKWQAWSPWVEKDPQAKNSFEGPTAGTGAVFHWSGNEEVGEGMMTLVESKPNESIRIKLDLVRPVENTNSAEFTFRPDGQQTVVTWAMTGKNNFIGKAICIFLNMDKMVGADFEKGLANMKAHPGKPKKIARDKEK